MAFKIVVLSCIVAVASAGIIPTGQLTYSAPITYTSHAVQAPITYTAPITKYAAPVQYATPIAKEVAVAPAPAQYSFSYDVQDGHTGDSKSAYETRDGDVVHGSYSVVDPDGTKRTVEYTADAHSGFNAVVHKEPYAVKVVAPVAKIAPPIAYAAAPVVHSAPVYHSAPVSYAAPAYAYHH